MSEPSFPVQKPLLQVSKTREKKEGFLNYQVEPYLNVRPRQNFDSTMDPKKLKRMISNRISAQKSKRKKLQYADDLLKKSQDLEMEVSKLRSLVGKAWEQKQCLQIEKNELEECTSDCLRRLISNQGELAANQLEIKRLKEKIMLSNLTILI